LPSEPSPELALWLCHRNFGIGADGLLILSYEPSGQPRMTIINSDGSTAEMCGNGIRCFASELVQKHNAPKSITIVTDAGEKPCRVSESNGRWTVAVEMGPIWDEGGKALLSRAIAPETIEVAGRLLQFYPASTGNPHAVLFGRFSRAEMEKLGPALTAHPRFPFQTNVEFVNPRNRNELDVTVHERGAGFTLACGTGSLASVAVAIATGACDPDQTVLVHLPGGDLKFNVVPDFSASLMEGPAERVFEGTINLPEELAR